MGEGVRGEGAGLTMGKREEGEEEEDEEEVEEVVRASRWDVFREGCVNDRSGLEREEVAVEVAAQKNSGTIKRRGIKMSREAAGTTRGF